MFPLAEKVSVLSLQLFLGFWDRSDKGLVAGSCWELGGDWSLFSFPCLFFDIFLSLMVLTPCGR